MSVTEGRNSPGIERRLLPPSYYNFEIMGISEKDVEKGITVLY